MSDWTAAETHARDVLVLRGVPKPAAEEIVRALRHPRGLAEGLLHERRAGRDGAVASWLSDEWESSLTQAGLRLGVDGMDVHRSEWILWKKGERAVYGYGFQEAMEVLAKRADGSLDWSLETKPENEASERERLAILRGSKAPPRS